MRLVDNAPADLLSDQERLLLHECGTPLALAYDGRDDIALAAGTLDYPATFVPTHHYGGEGQLPWVDIGASLPTRETCERW